jgi:hypothetical protein
LIPYFKQTPNKTKRAKEITKSLMKFVINDLRPLSIIEGEGFLEFMEIAIPEYIIPSKQKITRLVEQTAIHERENLKCFLKNIPHVCITIDFWTSLVNHSYLGITYHYLEKWCLRTRILETVEVPESHTSINIVNKLKSILKFWNIEIMLMLLYVIMLQNGQSYKLHGPNIFSLMYCSLYTVIYKCRAPK